MADHFHCIFLDDTGAKGEIEGGWTARTEEQWAQCPDTERTQWLHTQAVKWGMPPTATVQQFWTAG